MWSSHTWLSQVRENDHLCQMLPRGQRREESRSDIWIQPCDIYSDL